MKEEKIICDGCGKQLNLPTSYPHNYCLRLSVVDHIVPSEERGVYMVHMTPPLKEDLDFCGMGCLNNWMKER